MKIIQNYRNCCSNRGLIGIGCYQDDEDSVSTIISCVNCGATHIISRVNYWRYLSEDELRENWKPNELELQFRFESIFENLQQHDANADIWSNVFYGLIPIELREQFEMEDSFLDEDFREVIVPPLIKIDQKERFKRDYLFTDNYYDVGIMEIAREELFIEYEFSNESIIRDSYDEYKMHIPHMDRNYVYERIIEVGR